MTASFAPFAAEFLHLTGDIVWCTATTVDAKGRPRSRILHPIWQVLDDQPVGWIVTGQTPIKTRHLAANPHLACSYWSPAQHTVAVDCVASWIEDAATRRHVFDIFMTTPPPLGYDLRGFGAEGPGNATFTPLRLIPWRVQITHFDGWFGDRTPKIWRANERN